VRVRSTNVAVVGGGPAGLMAAEVLASAGLRVSLFEHRRSLGRKFLLAGRGGLNITHAEEISQLVTRYGPAQRRLEAAVRAFSPADLSEWCANHGEAVFVGTSDRVFPKSFRATPLLRSWLRSLDDLGITVHRQHRWLGWAAEGELRFEVGGDDTQHRTVETEATIFALGGKSWPRVSSNASWVEPFRSRGVHVAELQAANCGVEVAWTSVMRSRFAGTPVKNASITVGSQVMRGDLMITNNGIEGGPIYAVGPELRDQLKRTGQATVVCDLAPDLGTDQLTERLSNRRPKSSATSWLRSAGLAPVTVALVREVTQNQIPQGPAALAGLIKNLHLPVAAMADIDRAISTAGGVAFGEIDEHFMLTKIPGSFVAGEMLDWEAPTGGYLLQACFSTGVAAANGALTWLRDRTTN